MHVATTHSDAINYELLVSSLPGLYLVLAPDLTILNASDAYLKSTLKVREDITGRKFFDVFPENPAMESGPSVNTLKKSLLHVLNFNTTHSIPVLRYDIPRPKSLGGGFEERYWMTANHPITDKNGKLLYIIHHVTDVTMQQMAHSQINTHRERYELLAQAATDVIWDWDLLNNHIWWSDGFQETFGYNKHDFSNIEDWSRTVHPEDRPNVIKSAFETIDLSGKAWIDSYRFKRQDGSYANIMERGYLLRDDKGVAYRMVGAMYDITEQINKGQKTKPEDKPAEKPADHKTYQKFLDAMPNLAWCIKPENGSKNEASYFNKAWQDYTGLSTDLLHGAEKVIYSEDLPAALAKMSQCLETQHTYEQELRLKNRKTGNYRWFLSRAVPIRDDKGKLSLWLGTCTDIDDNKKLQAGKVNAEKTTAPATTNWERILTETPLNVAVFTGPKLEPTFISPGFKQATGSQEVTTQSLKTNLPGFSEVLATVFNTGEPVMKEQAAFCNGTISEVETPAYTFSFQPITDEAGKPKNVVVTAVETKTPAIAAPQQPIHNPEDAQPEPEKILEHIPLMALAFSKDGKPIAFNALLATYAGLEGPVKPESWENLLHPEDREHFNSTWQLASHTGSFQEISFRLKNNGGAYQWFSAQAKPVKSNTGQNLFWVVTATSLDALKHAETNLQAKNQELQQIHQNLDQFVYTTAHDLKKPVNNLEALFAELTKTAEFKDPEADRLIELFNHAIQKTYGNINHFAEIAGATENPEEATEVVPVQKATSQVLNQLQETIKRSQAVITTNFAAHAVNFSEEKLKRVLYTLLSNSLQYAAPDRKPEISISSHLAGSFTIITVQDNGLGIDLEKNGGKMFRMFQRFHPHLPGKGLGLYLLHRLVTSHGGRVEVESAVNQGTTFRIYLKKPITNILLIDEDEASNYLNKRQLSHIETAKEITVETSGQEALAHLEEACETGKVIPDLIFLDLNMPVMNGFGFLEEYAALKGKFPQLPEVILISSYTSPADLVRIHNHPMVKKHVPNPLTENSIGKIMHELAGA